MRYVEASSRSSRLSPKRTTSANSSKGTVVMGAKGLYILLETLKEGSTLWLGENFKNLPAVDMKSVKKGHPRRHLSARRRTTNRLFLRLLSADNSSRVRECASSKGIMRRFEPQTSFGSRNSYNAFAADATLTWDAIYEKPERYQSMPSHTIFRALSLRCGGLL